MKVQLRVRPNLLVEIEASTQKELFEQLASYSEVFGDTCCGLCKSTNIKPVWRIAKKGKMSYDYPEWQCLEPHCKAKLVLQSNLEGGTLYPQRRLLKNGKPKTLNDTEEGAYGEHNGWTKYRGESND